MMIEGALNVERYNGYFFADFTQRGSGSAPCGTWDDDDQVLRNRLDYLSVGDVNVTLRELRASGRVCRFLRVDEDMLRLALAL